MTVKFVHTNIVAKDWKKLAQFYMDVFDCKPVYPERNLYGDWIDKVTNIPDVHIQGIHLILPGYNDKPTLEIFEYNKAVRPSTIPGINTQGLAHLAFEVENVETFCQKVLENGGCKLGETAVKSIEGVGILTVVYTRDPEGNIVEIQSWKKI